MQPKDENNLPIHPPSPSKMSKNNDLTHRAATTTNGTPPSSTKTVEADLESQKPKKGLKGHSSKPPRAKSPARVFMLSILLFVIASSQLFYDIREIHVMVGDYSIKIPREVLNPAGALFATVGADSEDSGDWQEEVGGNNKQEEEEGDEEEEDTDADNELEAYEAALAKEKSDGKAVARMETPNVSPNDGAVTADDRQASQNPPAPVVEPIQQTRKKKKKKDKGRKNNNNPPQANDNVPNLEESNSQQIITSDAEAQPDEISGQQYQRRPLPTEGFDPAPQETGKKKKKKGKQQDQESPAASTNDGPSAAAQDPMEMNNGDSNNNVEPNVPQAAETEQPPVESNPAPQETGKKKKKKGKKQAEERPPSDNDGITPTAADNAREMNNMGQEPAPEDPNPVPQENGKRKKRGKKQKEEAPASIATSETPVEMSNIGQEQPPEESNPGGNPTKAEEVAALDTGSVETGKKKKRGKNKGGEPEAVNVEAPSPPAESVPIPEESNGGKKKKKKRGSH